MKFGYNDKVFESCIYIPTENIVKMKYLYELMVIFIHLFCTY